jgi:DNA gyrase subunit B
LGNGEVEGIVNTVVGEALTKYLEENPKSAKIIAKKGLLAAEAREAAKKAKDLIRKRKDALGGSGLPGKLRDCISSKMEECELYLVEGDSAGGSAEGGRFRETQAILPLRGKIINAYKSRDDKVLANEEVQSMIQAIGSGIGSDQDIGKRRYNRIIIMTDADVDGSHIRTLLLCFFYRQMYQLVAGGHVYVAQPPLFRVVRGKKEKYYVQTEETMKSQLLEKGLSDSYLVTEDGRKVDGEKMRQLCQCLASMEDGLTTLERRGISLRAHKERAELDTGRMPVFHLTHGNQDHWFVTRDKMDAFLNSHGLMTEADSKSENGNADNGRMASRATPSGTMASGTTASGTMASGTTASGTTASGTTTSGTTTSGTTGNGKSINGKSDIGKGAEKAPRAAHVVELHEVRTINAGLRELASLGFVIDDLIPKERTGATESRYRLFREESEAGMEDLRQLLPTIRAAGEKGLQITRFKGLGEMNAEELRETTLDPANRTMVKVTLPDAAAADELFRVLMGDKVEPRREFIEKHALEVRNLDV